MKFADQGAENLQHENNEETSTKSLIWLMIREP